MRGTKICLSQELRDDLERFARSRTLAARLVQRAQIVLMAAARKSDQEIAQAVGVVRQTVGLWRSRFVEHGITGRALAPVPVDGRDFRRPERTWYFSDNRGGRR